MEDLIYEFIKQPVWSVVGASTNPEKFGNIIFRNLLHKGYRVYGVNRRQGAIEDHQFYPNLSSLPEKPDVVDIVVPPPLALETIRECAFLGIHRIWLQPGAESPEAIQLGAELGLKLISQACCMVHCRPGRSTAI